MAQAKNASALAQGNVSQPHQWLEALVWTIQSCPWRGYGEKVAQHQKTKSKSVFVLHGCQRLKGCPLNSWTRKDLHSSTASVPIPQRQDCEDESMPVLLFDLVSAQRMNFLLSAPQCTGKQGPGRAPAVMLI